MTIPLLSELVSATVEGVVADIATIRNGVSTTALSSAVAPFTPTVYAATELSSSVSEVWTSSVLTLAAPANATTIYEYIVRAHGYPTSTPTVGYVEESVVIRVSRNSGGTAAVIVGNNKPFNNPKLRATLNAASVTIDIRADASAAWTWTLSQLRTLVPFDGQRVSSSAATIGTGSSWITLCTIPGPLKNGDQMLVQYSALGRFNTTGTTWSFIREAGTAAITMTGGTVAVAATDTVFADARVQVAIDAGNVVVQAQQHATENWTFSATATAESSAI